MTKEYYCKHLVALQTEGDREDVIRLCREYEKFCRKNGDLDGLAEVLDTLSMEMDVSEHPDARIVFDDLLELRKALAQNDFISYGQAYALLLNRYSYTWTETADEAIAYQKEAMDIYKQLGLYDEKGFDIGFEDAFGYLGKLYCFNSDYTLGIHYTTIALERALIDAGNDFLIGIYYRRLGIAYLSIDNTTTSRQLFQKAIEYFTNANQTDPDPIVYPEVTGSCCQLLKECNGRTHSDEYYKQWLVG